MSFRTRPDVRDLITLLPYRTTRGSPAWQRRHRCYSPGSCRWAPPRGRSACRSGRRCGGASSPTRRLATSLAALTSFSSASASPPRCATPPPLQYLFGAVDAVLQCALSCSSGSGHGYALQSVGCSHEDPCVHLNHGGRILEARPETVSLKLCRGLHARLCMLHFSRDSHVGASCKVCNKNLSGGFTSAYRCMT